jgi:cobalt-zinc-cadmium efflux system outer membrane protein
MMSVIRGIESRLQVVRRLTIHVFLFALCATPLVTIVADDLPAQSSHADSLADGILELDEAVTAALENNPALASLEARVSAISTVPSQVSALPDPRLSLNMMNLPVDTFDFDQEAMTQMQVAISQSFPFPGKRGLKQKTAEHQTEAAIAMLAERRGEISGRVRSAWWRLMQFGRALQIVEQNKDLMRDFVDIAQTKYKVGNGLQQDVLLAQLELSRLLGRELQLRGMRDGAQAELNKLLNRPVDRLVVLPGVPGNTTLPELPPQSTLLQQAGISRELIAVQRDLVEAARARLDLAKRDRYPDFKLGVGYGFRQGYDPMRNGDRSDLFSVMLSVNVPIYSRSKQSKAVEQRTFEVSQQSHALNDTVRSVEANVSKFLAKYRADRDQVVLLETAIIPQAQQTVSSMLAGYQVNQVDFLNLVNTQITLYNAQISYWESLSSAKQTLASLAAATGLETLYE